jgi:hypothetical protein
MFSDHFKKVEKMPGNALLGIAACVLFLGQLAALVLVVQGQVEKAYLRDAQSNSAQMVVEDCSENLSGAARSHCIEQVNAALDPLLNSTGTPQTPALARLAGQGGEASASSVRSFMQTMFASRQ